MKHDGTFNHPWDERFQRKKNGWVQVNLYKRIHYIEGEAKNHNGPCVVMSYGEREWHDGNRLLPNIFSSDLPGGGRAEPWSHGFDIESEK